MKFSKHTASFPLTYELGQMTEIPLGMDLGTIRIEKFHTKTVSIRSFPMFEDADFVGITHLYLVRMPIM